MLLLIRIINTIVSLLTLLVFIYTLLSFFLSPYHPIRETLGKIIEPMLAPIRNIIPPIGGLDFSPIILIILLQIFGSILTSVFRNWI